MNYILLFGVAVRAATAAVLAARTQVAHKTNREQAVGKMNYLFKDEMLELHLQYEYSKSNKHSPQRELQADKCMDVLCSPFLPFTRDDGSVRHG